MKTESNLGCRINFRMKSNPYPRIALIFDGRNKSSVGPAKASFTYECRIVSGLRTFRPNLSLHLFMSSECSLTLYFSSDRAYWKMNYSRVASSERASSKFCSGSSFRHRVHDTPFTALSELCPHGKRLQVCFLEWCISTIGLRLIIGWRQIMFISAKVFAVRAAGASCVAVVRTILCSIAQK